jgi:hypothetical protein
MNLTTFQPKKRDDVATVSVDNLVLAVTPDSTQPVVLDSLGAELLSWLDGTASVDELVDDLADATGAGPVEARTQLESLLNELSRQRLLHHGTVEPDGIPRRLHPSIPGGSCVAEILGLGRGAHVQVRRNGVALCNIAATDGEWLNQVTAALPAPIEIAAVDATPLPTFALRTSVGRSRRLQQLFDSYAAPRWWGFDPDAGRVALGRTVGGWLAAISGEGVWYNLPGIRLGDAALTAHPSLWPLLATPQVRTALHEVGAELVDSGLARVVTETNTPLLQVPADVFGSDSDYTIAHRGVLSPGSADGVWRARLLLQSAWQWDAQHLAAFAQLSATLPQIAVDPAWSLERVTSFIAATVGSL